jgi:short-subunit dehydrogenase
MFLAISRERGGKRGMDKSIFRHNDTTKISSAGEGVKQNPLNKKTVLITGASVGIGRALAYEFAKRGYQLVLIARRETQLNELASDLNTQYGVQSTVMVADLNTDAAVTQIISALIEKNIQIEVLVNNAGLGEYGYFANNKIGRIAEMVQINIMALVKLTHALLPSMRARQSGYILNVASTAGLVAVPMMSVYAASKAFVVHFTEAIAIENRDVNIHMTILCPGPTLTEFAKSAHMADAKPFSAPLMNIMSAHEVAKIGVEALFKHCAICIPGWRNRIMLRLGGLLPKAWRHFLTYYFMKKR